MFIVQLITSAKNKVVEEKEFTNEIKAMDFQKELESKYEQNGYYVDRFCSDCGNERCTC